MFIEFRPLFGSQFTGERNSAQLEELFVGSHQPLHLSLQAIFFILSHNVILQFTAEEILSQTSEATIEMISHIADALISPRGNLGERATLEKMQPDRFPLVFGQHLANPLPVLPAK